MLKLYRNLKPFTLMVLAVFILVFFQAVADLQLPTYMSDIINNGVMNLDFSYIWRIGGLMLVISAAGAICAVLASLCASKTAMGLGTILRSKVFRRAESFSLSEFDKIGTATMITRSTNDIVQIQNVTVMILRMMIYAPMMCIGGIIMAVRQDAKLTLVLAVALPIIAVLIVIVAQVVIPIFRGIQTKIDRINLVLRESLTGIRVIRAFNRVEDSNKRFDGANEDLTVSYIKVNRIIAFMMPLMMIIMNLTSISIIWFGGLRVADGMEIGKLVAFIQYAMQIMFSFVMVAMIFIMVPRAQAAADRVNEVLETKPLIKDPEKPAHSGGEQGVVEFRDVSFRYQGSELPALKNVSFTAKPGEVTAIIGSTGSGKSSLVNLIPRFYDAESGAVLVDGVDVRDYAQQELRAKIGFVPQKSVLFTGTITENIRFGKPDATDDEVREAARIAQATEFIETTEDGYEHVIAESGGNVSGGQKQRLSIARALVRRPEIYVFDDSFSALDFKTDAALRAALRKVIAHSTVFIISQRVSTVMDADRILVLDEGNVVGIGKHRELLKTCEIYHEIASSQLSEEELA